MIMMPKSNMTISGDINKQLLGLTDEHIHFLSNDDFSEEKTEPNKARKQVQTPAKSTIGIHHQMLTAFKALSLSAKEANLELKIASGFRSFERQLHIWNNKFTGKTAIKKANGEIVDINGLSDWKITEAILLYSALPGASRHHWGCDIDVFAPNLLTQGKSLQLEPWEYQQSGPMEQLSSWLTQNAAAFGFYLPYEHYQGGVAAEPWHLSYAPLAKQYQEEFNIQTLSDCLMKTDITGKLAITGNLTQIAQRYINNINDAV